MDDPCEVSSVVGSEVENVPSAPPPVGYSQVSTEYALRLQHEQQLQYEYQLQYQLQQQQQQHYQQQQQQQQYQQQQYQHHNGQAAYPSAFVPNASAMSWNTSSAKAQLSQHLHRRSLLCSCCSTLGWSCCSIASFYFLVPLCIVTLALSIVSSCGSGDVFFAGWSTPGTGSGFAKDYRLTLRYETSCDADAGDTFCTEFFSDTLVAIDTLPGGDQLVAQNLLIQCSFGFSALIILSIFARLIALKCRACCNSGGGASLLGSALARAEAAAAEPQAVIHHNAQYKTLHTLNVISHFVAAGPCVYALLCYAGAVGSFMGLQGPAIHGWDFDVGFRCGIGVIIFHCVSALFDACIACSLGCCPPQTLASPTTNAAASIQDDGAVFFEAQLGSPKASAAEVFHYERQTPLLS